MANEIQIVKAPITIQSMIHDQKFIERAQDTLGSGTQQFLSSVLSLVNSDPKIKALDPVKLYNCCLMAAAIKLPFNQNLGQAYIIPYKNEPQLQIGWKGFVQLAQRSGQFQRIDACEVYDGDTDEDVMKRLTSVITPRPLSTKIIGYVAYFRLNNGFEKTLYMTIEELDTHAKRYSQTFKAGYGVWKDNFDAMARKTVIKLILNRFAPLSIDMAKAIEIDQADSDGNYADNKPRVEVIDAELGESEEDRNNNQDRDGVLLNNNQEEVK
jgi:recombination protein RecT